MNYLLDEHDDVPAHAEREFTLSTGSILGLFFGLVLLCGLFFGFGYSVGSHRSPQTVAVQTPENAPAANFNAFKPAAGVAVGAASNSPLPSHGTTAATSAAPSPTTRTTSSDAITATPSSHTLAPTSSTPAPIVRVAPSAPATTAAPSPAGGYFLVQIAAVSHQQDANLLVNALRARGYAAIAYPQQDNLIHVQVGPLNNRHDAELMRQRLVTDGYNPIIK
jgi:cell division septation protein DedD